MSKLSLMQVSEDELNEVMLTPASSLRCLNDESLLQKKKKSPRKSLKKSNFRSGSRRSITNLHGCDKHLTKAILFVFGYQNISTYLLLNIKCEKDPDFIQRLVSVFFWEKFVASQIGWDRLRETQSFYTYINSRIKFETNFHSNDVEKCRWNMNNRWFGLIWLSQWKLCIDGVKNLERHFQQCFEGIPQTQTLNAANDSYGYLHLHSRWDTLQHGGVWTPRQTDVVNTIREHFTNDTSLTDVTVRWVPFLEITLILGYMFVYVLQIFSYIFQLWRLRYLWQSDSRQSNLLPAASRIYCWTTDTLRPNGSHFVKSEAAFGARLWYANHVNRKWCIFLMALRVWSGLKKSFILSPRSF